MRAFVVFCFIASAYAQYDYNAPSLGQGVSGLSGVSQSVVGSVGPQGNFGGYSSQAQQAVEYNKEFYSYSANDNDFHDSQSLGNLGTLKKNLRVVFIKGPESTGLEDAAVQLAKSAGDQRTAIYVLNKQADLSDLANKLNALGSNVGQKPEVHFVKYRTQADAENAQRAIQAQYDSSLPGPSSSAYGGQAPVLDYASKIPAHSAPVNSYVPPPAPAAPANSYIPPSAPQASYLPPGRRI